ncbi:MAG: single-stranded DNA endonuclease, partial [Candidatus Hydrothermarchaeaceae archaeon]
MAIPTEMLEELEKASGILREFLDAGEAVRVVTHNDADGLSAGAILHKAVLREGSPAHTQSLKQMDEKFLKHILAEKLNMLIFADMGSGQLDLIRKYLGEMQV